MELCDFNKEAILKGQYPSVAFIGAVIGLVGLLDSGDNKEYVVERLKELVGYYLERRKKYEIL
jgi:hypothetical protein